MIYDIKLIESEFNLFNKPLIRVANAYNLNNFCYQDNENNLTLSENVLSKNKNMFKINFDYDFLFLDSKDNIYVKKDNILYTSRLDKKIDINIPQSITYHNTEFIEISSDDTDSFFVTLFFPLPTVISGNVAPKRIIHCGFSSPVIFSKAFWSR